ESAPTHTLEERPRALIDWLHDNPYLSTSDPRPVSFGGFTGLQIDVAYKSPPGPECAPFESDAARTRLFLFPGAESSFCLDPGERVRFISVDHQGVPLTLQVGTYHSAHYDDWQAIVAPVLESISIPAT